MRAKMGTVGKLGLAEPRHVHSLEPEGGRKKCCTERQICSGKTISTHHLLCALVLVTYLECFVFCDPTNTHEENLKITYR